MLPLNPNGASNRGMDWWGRRATTDGMPAGGRTVTEAAFKDAAVAARNRAGVGETFVWEEEQRKEKVGSPVRDGRRQERGTGGLPASDQERGRRGVAWCREAERGSL